MIYELPYIPDSSQLFVLCKDLPWSIFLDSGNKAHPNRRYDIISAAPVATLVTNGSQTAIETSLGNKLTSEEDPFSLIQQYLNTLEIEEHGLPFNGGAIGYWSYDLGRRLEVIPEDTINDLQLPEMAVGIYHWAIIVDHQCQATTLLHADPNHPLPISLTEIIAYCKNMPGVFKDRVKLLSAFESNMDEQTYQQAFWQIQQHIAAGNCYQVNLAQRFCAKVSGSSFAAYLKLRQASPVPFGAFLQLPFAHLLSLSPERFIQCRKGVVETKPIKGTRPRGNNPTNDAALFNELKHSEKDQAENLMIVDLLRNDISRNCIIGSVKVSRLFAIESYANVHHLVSTIIGELAENKTCCDLLRDCFPGGSITGAPKIAAMKIIEALEPHRRDVYCGSIGYISANGNMDSNICIRTMTWHQDNIYCSAGGGIVADSDVVAEYAETFAKVNILLHAIGRQ